MGNKVGTCLWRSMLDLLLIILNKISQKYN